VKALFVFGTRPEAIKLSPVIRHFRQRSEFEVRVAVTAQHRELLDEVLTAFEIEPDYDLNTMLAGQSLAASAARILAGLEPVYRKEKPAIVFVQGDTTTTLCGALGAFYQHIPVGHIEAGLRTGNLASPFPEEMNRVLTGRLAAIHFAATEQARAHLLKEGVSAEHIQVTGNSGIDAVLYVRDRLAAGELQSGQPVPGSGDTPGRYLVVVTAHRRESFGAGFENICRALRRIAERGDTDLVYPVHPNPQVSEPVRRLLGAVPHIHLIQPLNYVAFVDLMRKADVLLTDSGGIQEEAPSLGKPVVVMRENTERPEAVEAGTALLAGTGEESIVEIVTRLLDDPETRARMARIHNPYGDGHASERIAAATLSLFKGSRKGESAFSVPAR
jgi:UDP-N-acetylglucosamine 2-epimerase (non-hydrolysing)